jgi:hypothetical protein
MTQDLTNQLEHKSQKINHSSIQINQHNITQQNLLSENKQLVYELERLNVIINSQKKDIDELRSFKIHF